MNKRTRHIRDRTGGTGPAPNGVMILALGIFISAFGTMGLLSLQLSKAPEGFEDENGFHFAAKSEENVVQGSFRTEPGVAIERRTAGVG